MKSINTSKTKHALLYMIPVIQVLDCKKKWSWRHICWNADPSWAWKQLMKYEMHWFRLKHNITLLFWLRPQTSRHSSCEILKFNVSQQTLHYWSQKLLLRCPSSSIGFWWCFSYYVYFNEKVDPRHDADIINRMRSHKMVTNVLVKLKFAVLH